jgi:hypothetical protein
MLIEFIMLAAFLKTGLACCWPSLRESFRSIATRRSDSTHVGQVREASSMAQAFGAPVDAMPSDLFEMASTEFAGVES